MTTAREIMTEGEERAGTGETVTQVARRMRDLGVPSLPVCGADGRVVGFITERDILVQCVAEGLDPAVMRIAQMTASKVVPVTVAVDAPLEQVLRTMIEIGVRRLPVVEGQRLVGTVNEADVARGLSQQAIGSVVADVSRAALRV